jgi:IS5 family transposase
MPMSGFPDPAMEDAWYGSESMRRFAGIELAEDAVPDESTILRFRHLLEQHKLSEGIFAQIRKLLEEKRLLLKSGTIVDATILAAPPSTKNAAGARDPEMHQTKKGKDWHFGMKAHVGTDRRGIVHSLTTTAANVHDSTPWPSSFTAASERFLGTRRTGTSRIGRMLRRWVSGTRINRRPNQAPLSQYQRRINRLRSRARARCEHVFHVVKRLWGLNKVRYRGLAKNTSRLFTAFALANPYLLRCRLLPAQATCR